MPFHGRAEYVPGLHSWLGPRGSCRFDDRYLCASSDLSVVSAMDDARGAGAAAPPKPQHVWKDITPPDEVEYIELKGRL